MKYHVSLYQKQVVCPHIFFKEKRLPQYLKKDFFIFSHGKRVTFADPDL